MKIDRLVSIIMLLLKKERIGAQELADMFCVSLRTIYRDIDAINLAGIPIYSISGVGGGFEIMPEYKIDNKVFSSTDLSAILTGLFGISGMMHSDEITNTLAKIKSFIPADRAKDIELKASQLYVDINPWVTNRNVQPYLKTIQTALAENRLLSFEYINHHGTKTMRTVEPYQLVLKNSHWYMHSFCLHKNEFRLFKLSRIINLQLQDATFTPRECQKPSLNADDIAEPQLITITLRIHQSLMERLLDYCAFDDFKPDGSNHYTVKFPFIENDYFYDMLLGFGSNCECISPPHVRAELQRRIHNIATLYNE